MCCYLVRIKRVVRRGEVFCFYRLVVLCIVSCLLLRLWEIFWKVSGNGFEIKFIDKGVRFI